MTSDATMNTDTNNEVRNFTFVWKIEDAIGGTRCFTEGRIVSPVFTTKTSFAAQWQLIFEQNLQLEDTAYVSLERNFPDIPWQIFIDYEISIWAHEEKPSHTKKGNKLKFFGTECQTLIGPVKMPEIGESKSFQRAIMVQCDITIHPDGSSLKEGAFALFEDLSKLLHTESYSDLELTAGHRKFRVHKIVLLFRAPSLLEHLGVSTSEKTFPETVEIADMDGDFLQELVYFLYSGRVRTRDPEFLMEMASVDEQFYIWSSETAFIAPVKKYVVCSKLQSERLRFRWSVPNFSSTKESKFTPIGIYGLNFKLIITFDQSDENIRFSVQKIPFKTDIYAKISSPMWASVRIEAGHEEGHLLPVVEEQICQLSDEVKWLPATSQFKDAVKGNNTMEFLKGDALVLNLFFILSDRKVKHEFECTELASDWMTSYEKDIEDLDFRFGRCDTFSDIELRVGGESFRAHRAILSARSSKLAEMIEQDMTDNDRGVLNIADVNSEIFGFFLDYIYTSNISTYCECKELEALYLCADRFNVPSLKLDCVNRLVEDLSEETVIDTLTLADDHADDRLKSAAVEFVCAHADEIFQSQEWKDFVRCRGNVATEVFLLLSEAVRKGLTADLKQLVE